MIVHRISCSSEIDASLLPFILKHCEKCASRDQWVRFAVAAHYNPLFREAPTNQVLTRIAELLPVLDGKPVRTAIFPNEHFGEEVGYFILLLAREDNGK